MSTKAAKTLTILGIITFSVHLIIFIWASFRGFEVTDEGFYLMMYEYPGKCISITTFNYIVSKLLGWLNPEIYHYRLFRVLLSIVGGVIFSVGFWYWFKKNYVEHVSKLWNLKNTILFITSGNLITCVFLAQSVSYNSLNNFFVLSSLVFLLIGLNKPMSDRTKIILLIGAGLLSGLNLFVKFSSFAACMAVIIIYLCFFYSGKNKFLILKNFIIGVICGFFIYFIIFQNPVLWFSEMKIFFNEILPHFKTHNNFYGLTSGYIKSIINLFSFMVEYFLPALFFYILFILTLRMKTDKDGKLFGSALLLVALGLFINKFTAVEKIFLHTDGIYLISLILLLNMIAFLLTTKLRINREKSYISAMLFVLPFLMSYGTNAYIILLSSQHIVPWFALFIILNVNKIVFPIIVMLFVWIHTWFAFLISPWRVDGSYFEQKL